MDKIEVGLRNEEANFAMMVYSDTEKDTCVWLLDTMKTFYLDFFYSTDQNIWGIKHYWGELNGVVGAS